MQPGTYNLTLYRGDTYSWQFKLWQDAGHTIPFDITGFTAKAEIRDAPGGTVLATLTTTVTDPNIVDVTLGVDLWPIAVPAKGGGKWDLQVSDVSNVHTVVAGSVTVTPDVTDST